MSRGLGDVYKRQVQGLRAKGDAVEVLHIVELLDQAYGGAPSARGAAGRG